HPLPYSHARAGGTILLPGPRERSSASSFPVPRALSPEVRVRGNPRGGASLSPFCGGPVGRKLYVGNLAYSVDDRMLEELFAAHGTVTSAQVIMDRDTGRSKGFGFVEMSSDAEAQAAITAMNLKEVQGRCLTVNEARPKTEGGGGGGRRGGGGGGGGYGGGRGGG